MGGKGGIGQQTSNLIGSFTGATQMADAAQQAAVSQQRIAGRQQAHLQQLTEGVTVEGLAQYDKALQIQDRNLARQEQLVASIDPTILEASQQALRLLRGEQSATLAPFQNQRNMQRQKLVDSLRQQLGPGAETSSAGMQALTRFDSETSTLFAGAQQQALGNLGQLGAQFNSFRPDMLQGAMGLGQLATNRAGLRFGQAGAMTGANQNVLQSAGAQYMGDMLRGQNQMSLIKAGGEAAATYYGSKAGAQAGVEAGNAQKKS